MGNREKNEERMKRETLSPMMRQYVELKIEHPDCLLFFRLGDFYELFFEDAVTAARELDIVLTGRDCGLQERAPMCGVPFKAMDAYLNKLIAKGHKVAICEQLTDPKDSNGLVERGVVRIVTPGTVIEESMLDEQRNNFLLSLCALDGRLGFAFVDVSTGEFTLGECACEGQALSDLLAQVQPAEIITSPSVSEIQFLSEPMKKQFFVYEYALWAYNEHTALKNVLDHFHVAGLDGYGCANMTAAISASGALLAYLNETQKNSLEHINRISLYRQEAFLVLDATTRRNLELTRTLRADKSKRGTLFGLLDKTQTAMGGRLLRRWIDQPLRSVSEIHARLDAVGELHGNLVLCDAIQDTVSPVYDLERICSRIAYGSVNARDAIALRDSLACFPSLKNALSQAGSAVLAGIYEKFDAMEDVCDLLSRAIADDPPVSVKEGGIIKEGYHEQIDQLRLVSQKAKDWLDDLEKREREATGIKNLRIGYNRVFGYYFEVTKSYLEQVPFRFQRKQTLANAERFFTQELKEFEGQIIGAEEKSVVLEYSVFCALRGILTEQIPRLQAAAQHVARLDVLCSLACAAREYNYVCPEVHGGNELDIQGGRHPVVEQMQSGRFVDNDAKLDNDRHRLLIITGPNMAGKSTYMRQVALISLMAHVGSFVPAKSAKIPLLDRIFTRVGASDDLSGGQSTFMVEMSETANILHNATGKSLLILDEIGRGTSTFDGLSIAWAVCEYIADKRKCGAKTLFATHYHELSELEGQMDGVVNYRISAKEVGEDVVFLRKVVRGGSDKSFGIHVARLAGVPDEVIERAKQVLSQLEAADLNAHMAKDASMQIRMPLNDTMRDRLKRFVQDTMGIDANALTPIEALMALSELQKKAQALFDEIK